MIWLLLTAALATFVGAFFLLRRDPNRLVTVASYADEELARRAERFLRVGGLEVRFTALPDPRGNPFHVQVPYSELDEARGFLARDSDLFAGAR